MRKSGAESEPNRSGRIDACESINLDKLGGDHTEGGAELIHYYPKEINKWVAESVIKC